VDFDIRCQVLRGAPRAVQARQEEWDDPEHEAAMLEHQALLARMLQGHTASHHAAHIAVTSVSATGAISVA
jgi:hypothetical protein